MSESRHRYSAAVVVLLLGAYVGAFYLLPWHWGGGFRAKQTWSHFACNTFFYPMRWLTQRTMHEWTVSVEKVDLEKRTLLLMVTPRNGYVVPYYGREVAGVRKLRVGDRIRAQIEYLPHIYTNTTYWEFRGYIRVEGEDPGGPLWK